MVFVVIPLWAVLHPLVGDLRMRHLRSKSPAPGLASQSSSNKSLTSLIGKQPSTTTAAATAAPAAAPVGNARPPRPGAAVTASSSDAIVINGDFVEDKRNRPGIVFPIRHVYISDTPQSKSGRGDRESENVGDSQFNNAVFRSANFAAPPLPSIAYLPLAIMQYFSNFQPPTYPYPGLILVDTVDFFSYDIHHFCLFIFPPLPPSRPKREPIVYDHSEVELMNDILRDLGGD
jgi:hypothetical protein